MIGAVWRKQASYRELLVGHDEPSYGICLTKSIIQRVILDVI